ncbi:hypothetical protein PSPO01_00812 [Paraphaeosphaeria sporulosa]
MQASLGPQCSGNAAHCMMWESMIH